jgi:hypothetical protein
MVERFAVMVCVSGSLLSAPDTVSLGESDFSRWVSEWWWGNVNPRTPPNPPLAGGAKEGEARRPIRALELVTGERLYVEWLRGDRLGAEFRWRGNHRFRVPWSLVASVSNPPGVVDVLAGQFANDAAPWRWESAVPLAAGECRWRQRSGDEEVRLHFGGDDAAAVLTLLVDDTGQLVLRLPHDWTVEFRQRLSVWTGWQTVSVDWDATRWRVLVGDAVLATGRAVTTRLQSVESASANTEVLIRALQQAPTQNVPSASVMLATGDVLFGDLIDSDRAGLQLAGLRGTVHIPWTEWAAVSPRPATNVSSHFVHGTLQHVRTAPPTWPRGLPEEMWLAVRVSRDEWEHPLLGRLIVPADDVMAGTVRHAGDFRWLHAGRVHLGDELRPTFHAPTSQGTACGGSFVLQAAPRGRCFLALDAAELEPSGPQTPPSEPFLAALHGGALRTELFINGRLVGDCNRLLSWRPPVARPERLRMEIPRDWLRVGENRWDLRQQPLAAGDGRFDDCELSHIALELE